MAYFRKSGRMPASSTTCFSNILAKRPVLVSQQTAFQPFLIHPLTIILTMCNPLVTVVADNNGFSPSSYHVLNPVRLVFSALPTLAQMLEFIDVMCFQICYTMIKFAFASQ